MNGRAHREFQGAVDAINRYADERGFTYLPNLADGDSHAEQFLYDQIKPDFIGISHRSGPCQMCQHNLWPTNVIITYDDKWVK